MLLKQIQLGLIHVAVAITLVPINSTLNRVMIKELAISAALVALLASLPYLFSPIQVVIGTISDRFPIFGLRRSPYIIFGLALCVFGLVASPQAAFLLESEPAIGIIVGLFSFGAWGMGYNFASVSYLSLATEISGEKDRSRTIAVMWFMMILSIIITSIVLSIMVDPYTPQALERAFLIVGAVAAALGLLGILGLEKRRSISLQKEESYSWITMLVTILKNSQATRFFVYLVILLAAILGQDILLEPFAGEAFGMTVRQTTRITSIWGVCFLVTLLLAGVFEKRVSKRKVAYMGGWSAVLGFGLIILSGFSRSRELFYLGVVTLGGGTGLATVSNLGLMLDMTVAGKVGLFIGAWGMANAISRFLGSILGGVVRDLVTRLSLDFVLGYVVVFGIELAFLLVSLWMLRRIDVRSFQNKMVSPSVIERAAVASDGA